MKKTALILLTLVFVLEVSAQQTKQTITFFDAEGNKTKNLKKAFYFTRLKSLADTAWQLDTYPVNGPMVRSETFKDKECTIHHGEYAAYKFNGFIDSTGYYFNNIPDGSWYFLGDAGNYITQKNYEKGELVKTIDLTNKKQETGDTAKADPNEKESEFKGGIRGWTKYLTENLRYPQEAVKSNIMGDVQILFIVDKDGKPINTNVFKSVQYFLDEEAMRLIVDSPAWVPAVQFGRKVKSYKKQPIHFRIER